MQHTHPTPRDHYLQVENIKKCSLKPQNILLPDIRHGVQKGQYGSTKSGNYTYLGLALVKCFPNICEDLGSILGHRKKGWDGE